MEVKQLAKEVLEFLTANDVKLFRSPAEGNILVRLVDVNFTPEQTLGRMIYSFSATAHEIDDINFNNFEKYGIQKVGEYSSYITRAFEKTSQYIGIPDKDLFSILQDFEDITSNEGLKKTIKYLSTLDIEFQSDPYLIVLKDGVLTPVTEANKDFITIYSFLDKLLFAFDLDIVFELFH